MKVARESILIVAIGVLDLTTTLLWVHNHGAQEANPVFSYYLALGPFWFALMKMVMLLAPVFLLEWAARHRPSFARKGARFAIAAYLTMYIVGVAQLNPQLLHPRHAGTTIASLDAPTGAMPVDYESHNGIDGAGPALTGSDSAIVYEGMR